MTAAENLPGRTVKLRWSMTTHQEMQYLVDLDAPCVDMSNLKGAACHLTAAAYAARRTFMSRQSCLRASKRSMPSYTPAAAFRVASLFMMLMISRPQRCTKGSSYDGEWH